MPAGRLLAYGLLGLPLAFAALPVYVHVPRYYAETRGLDLATLGLLLLVMRLGDAVLDPWLGRLADRLPRRTLFIAALPPFAAGFTGLFNPPDTAGTGWLAAMLALTYLGYSTASIACQAWGADLGQTSGERTRLTASREGWTLAGVLLAAALPGWLAGGDLNLGIERLSWLLPPLLLCLVLPALVTLPTASAAATVSDRQPANAVRPVTPESATDAAPQLSASPTPDASAPSYPPLLADPALRRLLAVFVLNGIAAALPATLFLFFVADVLGNAPASGPLLALYFVAGAAGLPLWVKLADRLGRPRAWLLAMILASLAFAGAGLLERGDLVPFAVICLASGLALGADLSLPAALAADLGERLGRAGAVFGLWQFAAKLNLALAAGLALPLLAVAGYTPGSASGLGALSAAYALLPLAFKAAAAALLWRWRHSLEN